MKLNERVQINDEDQHLISTDIILEESESGRATITIQAHKKPEEKGIIFYDAGYAKTKFYRIFIGYIDKITQATSKSWILYCHELSHILSVNNPISLRNCQLNDVLNDIEKETNLNILHPSSASYSTKNIPRFANQGDALHAIRNIPRVFNIEGFVFYQVDDADIWLGSYKDSPFAKLPNINIPEKFFTKPQINNRVSLPIIPALRPGHRVNGHRLHRVRFTNEEMLLQWKK